MNGNDQFYNLCLNSDTNGFNMDTLKHHIQELKSDLNVKCVDGMTPFYLLCYHCTNPDMIKYCVKEGNANLNIQNNDGNTPFYVLCYFSYKSRFNIDLLKFCVEEGHADFNIANKNGETPFYILCSKIGLYQSTLQYCLDNGANMKVETRYGKTPQHYLKVVPITPAIKLDEPIKKNKINCCI